MTKEHNEHMKLLLDFTNKAIETYSKVSQRCMMEGCRYGYTQKKIQDTCIYCGTPRHDPYPDNLKRYAEL